MKKVVTLALVLALSLALFSMTASAAAIKTPFSDDSLKVAVVEKFEDTSYDMYLGQPDGATNDLPEAVSLAGGKLTLSSGADAFAWIGFASPGMKALGKSNAEGFGFYVNNTSDVSMSVSFPLITVVSEDGPSLNKNAYNIIAGGDYVLVAKDGTETTVTAVDSPAPQSRFVIPAKFEGHVILPFANTVLHWTNEAVAPLTANDSFEGFGFGGSWPDSMALLGDDGKIIIDNLFFYGANVAAKDADLVLGKKDDGKDDDTDTGDISLIAPIAALVAALPAGALVLRKKNQK